MSLDSDDIYWLAVSHLQGVSVPKLLSWLEVKKDYRSLFIGAPADWDAAGFTKNEIDKIKTVNWQTIEAEQRWHEKNGEVITLKDLRYPRLLKELADPPLVLYVRGEVDALSLPQIAMVGSRHPSPLGQETAARFSRALVEKGFIITSGLAMGIDSVCHQNALLAQGKTLAVMGTGVNQIYPLLHQRLAEKIMQQGALISEFPLNTPPSPWNFPRRNRIISGLSLGVLVVEAAQRSGSLITARCAVEQNREVFAIPGSINHALSRGCHQLIRQGAKLVESVDDIIEELGALTLLLGKKVSMPDEREPLAPLDLNHQALCNYIDYAVTTFDSILWRSQLTASEVSSMLLSLELKGYVQAIQGGYIRCV